MVKTSEDIMADFRRLLMGSPLVKAVSGKVYLDGQRPRDSRREDIIVRFTNGEADQVETGTVTVLVFVPDIQPDGDGTTEPDHHRLHLLAAKAQQWRDGLRGGAAGDYLIHRRQQTIAADRDDQTGQHFISVRVAFSRFADE